MDSKPPRLTGSPMLVVKRKLRETWSQAVESPSAWSFGRSDEVLGAYQCHLKHGASEHEAAYNAFRQLNALWPVNEPLPGGDGGAALAGLRCASPPHCARLAARIEGHAGGARHR